MQLSEQNAGSDAFRAWLRRERIADRREFDTLVDTYRHLRELRQSGRNHIWGLYRAQPQPADLAVVRLPARRRDRRQSAVAVHALHGSRPCRGDSATNAGRASCGRAASSPPTRIYRPTSMSSCAELYLRSEGTIALVMPYGAHEPGSVFAGFRGGRYNTTEVRFTQVWAFDERVQPMFPMPSTVFFAQARAGRSAAGNHHRVARFPAACATPRLEEAERGASAARRTRGQRRRRARGARRTVVPFRQGATLVPRSLCLVERQADRAAWLPIRRHRWCRAVPAEQDKRPWRDLPALQGTVESQFLRPISSWVSRSCRFRVLATVAGGHSLG